MRAVLAFFLLSERWRHFGRQWRVADRVKALSRPSPTFLTDDATQ